jgi:hypothetical protein
LFAVLDNLPLIEAAQAGSLDSRDMDKNISSAALRLNRSVLFLRIELLHRTARLLISMQKIHGTHANSV